MISPESLAVQIEKNLAEVEDRIKKASVSAHHDYDKIKLVVVSKAKSVEVVKAAIQVGIRNFGENYPEQAEEKIKSLQNFPDVKWHMIGHLQSRKSNLVAENFDYLHSLDSLKLAKKLDRQLVLQKKVLPVLLEFNVANEASKYGWNAGNESQWKEFLPDIESILEISSLRVLGLMCMPPISENAEDSRQYFVKLVRLRDFIAKQFPDYTWDELSMGTSFDFEIAIQEGATFVRVGQAILGPRP